MTIEKIKVQHPTSYNIGLIEEKLNTIIDWINEHDNSGRHIVPSSSLTGGEKGESCTVCNWTNHNLKYGICDGCRDKVPEPKSNTLREGIGNIIQKLSEEWVVNKKEKEANVNKILSLVKKYVGKKRSELPHYDRTGTSIMNIIKNL